MNSENTNHLHETYPNLYKKKTYFECRDGWFHVIDKLSSKLEKIIQNSLIGDHMCASQVKEEYGTLSFYMYLETEDATEAIKEAFEESARTCEICGKEGQLMKGKWMETRCKEHA